MQLLINYANEKLQANFTKTTFENEEGMYLAEGTNPNYTPTPTHLPTPHPTPNLTLTLTRYLAEGIQFDHIEYADNAPVLQLIEGKGGIVPMVDEESNLP